MRGEAATPEGGGMIDPPSGSVLSSNATADTPGLNITQATSVPESGPRFRARSIVFTINRWDDALVEQLRLYGSSEVEYMRFGFEIAPTTGREHIQGWLQWSNPRQVNKFWALFNHPFIQSRYGTVDDNQRYTAKDGRWEEFGTPPVQGERADWKRAVQLLGDQSVHAVVLDQPHLLPSIRALERFHTLSRQPPKDRDVQVIYIHGPSGCGKTRSIHELYPDAYWKPNGDWWDGYEGQPVVVLDDFYSDLPWAQLLRVLDRYPLRVPVKGGFVSACWTTVLISSNHPIEQQYPGHVGIQRQPLYRRIHCVIDGFNGISAEHITNALREAPVRPQVQTPKVPHDWAPTDPTPGSSSHAQSHDG